MVITKTLLVKNEIIDPSIAHARTENCNMSILFTKDGLVFSILRNDVGKFIVLGEYQLQSAENQTNLFEFKNRLPGDFNLVNLGYFGTNMALFPSTLFDASDLQTIANFHFNIQPDEVVQYEEIKPHGMVVVYTLPKTLLQAAKSAFPQLDVVHAGGFTTAYYLNEYKNKPGDHLHVHLWKQHAEICVIRNGKLLLYNIFEYITQEDLLYIILNVFEQLELNPETLPLKLSGEIEKATGPWPLLETYIRFVELENRPTNYQYSHEFKGTPTHKYNRVFQTATCAL